MSGQGSLIERNATLRLGTKRRRMERVLHFFHHEHMATTAIALEMGIAEQEVCDLLDEADRGR